MSLYITVPINENGLVYANNFNSIIDQAMGPAPFAFEDVYVYSHGWSTNAILALNEYNEFSVELAKLIAILDGSAVSPFLVGPKRSFGVGVHWPSEITEDLNSELNKLQLFTFYTMEKRADAVGQHAVYALLRLVLENRAAVTNIPLRINLIGHSFGCKVVASALQAIYEDVAARDFTIQPTTQFNCVLLQGALEDTQLDDNQCYGDVKRLPNLRMLVTYSTEDRALGTWFPLAHEIANVFLKGKPVALGAGGPTAATTAQFGSALKLSVGKGFTHAALAKHAERLITADLSPFHKAHTSYDGGFSGHHSDINVSEIYELISGFLFQVK